MPGKDKSAELLGKTRAQKIIDGLKPAGGFSVKETRKIEEDIRESLLHKLREINSRPPVPPGKKLY